MNNTPENKKLIVECECLSEHLMVEKDFEDPVFYISFYRQGQTLKPTLHDKWKHIKQILKTGVPYADNIVINFKEAKDLIDFLKVQMGVEK